MPTVTYTGPWYSRPSRDVTMPEWVRGRSVEVSQAWLDEWRHTLGDGYRIDGDDGGSDGIPDENWNRPEIVEWLSSQGVDLGIGYKTKSTLLGMVDGVLNPAPVVEPVVEETVEEEIVVEEPVVEEPVVEETVEIDDTTDEE